MYAAAGAEVWLGESKWWRGRKAGVLEVESLLAKGRMVKNQELWSGREDLNALLAYVGLKTLPDISK